MTKTLPNEVLTPGSGSRVNVVRKSGRMAVIQWSDDRWPNIPDDAGIAFRIAAGCVNARGTVTRTKAGKQTVSVELAPHETLSGARQETYVLLAVDETGKPTMLAAGRIYFD